MDTGFISSSAIKTRVSLSRTHSMILVDSLLARWYLSMNTQIANAAAHSCQTSDQVIDAAC